MTNLQELVARIEDCLHSLNGDVLKFEKGNNAAGTRIRKGLMEIKKLAHDGRGLISAIKLSSVKGE